AVVTNHLVVRGSYRSLSLVIYGNTAEDLGQFNIELDDSSLTDLVGSAAGKLEDLPLALHSLNRTIEEMISSLHMLSPPIAMSDILVEAKQLLRLMPMILEVPNLGNAVHKVVSAIVSVACSYVSCDLHCDAINHKDLTLGRSRDSEELRCAINEAKKGLLELYEVLQHELGNASAELAECTFLGSESDLASSNRLVNLMSQYFCFSGTSSNHGNQQLSQSKDVIMGLSVALLLCSGRESCFHFVSSGGVAQLSHVFGRGKHNSTAVTFLLLGVVEQATRHSIGCEGFLGWWPREDENVPSGISEGYSHLLKFLLQKPRHDVASLTTYILHRLRFYEIASRYECAVLSMLGSLSAVGRVTSVTLDKLMSAKLQIKKLSKLINSRDPIEDPSQVACASRSLILGQTEGLLSYKATNNFIASSNCCFSNWDIDSHLLALLKERGFLPLSAALLSSSILRSQVGDAMGIFVDIASSIGAIILSLLLCRAGIVFLLHHPEVCATVLHALTGANDMHKEECVPLRYASVLISKGFACGPREVGTIIEIHLRVLNAIDRLLLSTPQSEEFLWVLWELCGLSRSDCGREALLALGFFPEAVSILIEALHSTKETEPINKNNGASPINLAISHSAAEIFEVIVTDPMASSLYSWIEHAMELYKALNSSSTGSNRKDAPARLLDWIDAGVVYHKNGAIGLLRYAALLASGGDGHSISTNILVSDLTEVENVSGESSNNSDTNVMENLRKIISDKSFDGVTLRDSSVAQLTTAFRILAFISENSTVSCALYDEGAMTVIYVVLVNCRFMLERSSNNFDYLVDEGTECNSTSDLLLERNREQSLVDLLIPSLVLLISLLQRLQETKEQHRNTKLVNSLLQLHREVSPKLAACAADLSAPYPDDALGFGAVCHLIVSALAFWPVYGWTPGLFHSLLASVQATSVLALGPKEICSLLCLLNNLFPEEGIWHWKNGMPLLSAFRTLAVGTLLGPQKEKQVNWYLDRGPLEKLLSQLTPHLDKIAQIIQHYAISSLVVIQDMLRVFVVRIAFQKTENASRLMRPILSWIRDYISDLSLPSQTDAYKVRRFCPFYRLSEHGLLLDEGVTQILVKVLERCYDESDSDGKQILDSRDSARCGFTLINWCLPAFKSVFLLCNSQTSPQHPEGLDLHKSDSLSTKDCSLILPCLLKLCQVLQVGKELLSCLIVFKEIGSCSEGRSAFLSTLPHTHPNLEELETEKEDERIGNFNLRYEFECKKEPPLLCCWKKLLKSLDLKDGSQSYAIEAVHVLSLGSLHFCMDGKNLNLSAVHALKNLFGLPDDLSKADGFPEKNIDYIQESITILSSSIFEGDSLATSDTNTTLYEVLESAKLLLRLLQKPTSSVKVDNIFLGDGVLLNANNILDSSKIYPMTYGGAERVDDYLYLGGLEDKFLWECPETLPDRLSQTALPVKRKMPQAEGSSRRARGENSQAEITTQNAFTRGSGPSSAPSGPTRRDAFRLRRPNSSRPTSLHVDDYVARERGVDGVTNSSAIAVQRVGSTGGRAPSIHVDQFMARERERLNPSASVVGEAGAQVKNAATGIDTDVERVNKSKQLKPDIDDDLQGIDIVFDGEESEADDSLPFPQPDDNLQQPAPVIVEQRSPHSIVEETESNVNEGNQLCRIGTPLALNVGENTRSEFSSRMSVSRPEMPLTREPSVSSDKKFFEHSDDSKNAASANTVNGFDSASANTSRFSASVYNNAPFSSVQLQDESRMVSQNFYSKNHPQHGGNVSVVAGSRGLYDQKILLHQPPLPPVPPPVTMSPVIPQTSDSVPNHSSPYVNSIPEVQPPPPMAFQVSSDYLSASLPSSLPILDSKYARTSISSPGGSARPPPPLPPTPPPFPSSPYIPNLKTSMSQSLLYNQSTVGITEHSQSSSVPMIDARLGSISASISGPTSYPPPPLLPHLVFNRPSSIPMTLYGNLPAQQQGENGPSNLQNLSAQSMHSVAQLQPLQPPQLPRPPQPPQHLRPPIQASQQLEQGVLLQGPVQMQVHTVQMLQQPQVSPIHNYYLSQQTQVEHAQPQIIPQLAEVSTQQQDPGMSLHEFFKSPEAIQSLLSDRDKLCQLLEQHPKLMQMLQAPFYHIPSSIPAAMWFDFLWPCFDAVPLSIMGLRKGWASYSKT
ncbi:LOW QUALITY PROTEIN: hypothetical protein CFOL_v3_17606, partial [Cephalotus follicularis]